MPHKLLIRDVPEDLNAWIEERRHQKMQTKQDFLMDLLLEAQASKEEQRQYAFNTYAVAQPASGGSAFTFIDLFAGIGGFRLGLQKVGGRCVFTSEWDKYAQRTYFEWFGDMPHGDITKIDPSSIPDHDVLAAGFPCQPFSIAGVSKKNSLGREHGFKDKTQGTLFFHVARIAEIKRPPVLLLENVKNLLSHDRGKTWQVIEGTLRELGYHVFHKIIDAQDYVPQHRERIFIVAFDKQRFGPMPPNFWFPKKPSGTPPCVADILEKQVPDRYTLSDHLWKYLQDYAEKHRQRGNGFGFGLVSLDGVARTLSARYYKDGSEILIPQGRRKNPRRLTPQECARLMGFDDSLPIIVSDTQAYKQFGNAVCPLVVAAVAKEIVPVLSEYLGVHARAGREMAAMTMTGVWKP